MHIALNKPGRITFFAIGIVAVLGVAACGSDDNGISVPTTKPAAASGNSTNENSIATTPDISFPDISLPDGVSVPDGIAGLNGQCTAYYQLFASAFTGGTSGMADLDDAVRNLQDQVPDDLKDDVAVVATAINKLVELGKKYEANPAGLYADPEAVTLFSDPSFTDSSEKVQNWLETECNTAG